MEYIEMLRHIFSVDALIYLAIAAVFVGAFFTCVMPLSGLAGKLRRAARVIVTESKQNKEKKSWNDLHFLGDALAAVWADFLQNAEMRDAHGESCDVTLYINEDTVIYAKGSRFAEIAPGILTSLGILGTFIGLVTGLSGLKISAADTTMLLSAMDKLIGGMSTAFLTSIAGVSASLAFNLLYNRAMGRCQKAIDRFCDVFSLYAMPKPVSEETAMLTLQQEQTAYMRQATEELSQRMAVQMEQSIMRAMLPVQRSMDNFIVAATQAQVDGMDRVAQLFVQRMNVALGAEFEHLRQTLSKTGEEQIRVQQEFRRAVDAVGQMTQDVINMHQMSQGILEHFKAYVDDMDASRAQVDDTNRQTLELLNAMNKTSGQQAMYLAKLQEYQAALTASSQQYNAWVDRFLASAQEQTRVTEREIDRAVQSMHDGAGALSGAYADFTAKTRENLENTTKNMARTTALFDESITASVRQINETVAAMRSTAEVMPQMLSQSRDRYAEQVDQFVAALVRLQKAMDKLSDTLEKEKA